MQDIRLKTADDFEQMAQELENASQHAKIAAVHLRQGDVPRFTAHAWAVQGHVRNAQNAMDAAAILHAAKARTNL